MKYTIKLMLSLENDISFPGTLLLGEVITLNFTKEEIEKKSYLRKIFEKKNSFSPYSSFSLDKVFPEIEKRKSFLKNDGCFDNEKIKIEFIKAIDSEIENLKKIKYRRDDIDIDCELYLPDLIGCLCSYSGLYNLSSPETKQLKQVKDELISFLGKKVKFVNIGDGDQLRFRMKHSIVKLKRTILKSKMEKENVFEVRYIEEADMFGLVFTCPECGLNKISPEGDTYIEALEAGWKLSKKGKTSKDICNCC